MSSVYHEYQLRSLFVGYIECTHEIWYTIVFVMNAFGSNCCRWNFDGLYKLLVIAVSVVEYFILGDGSVIASIF